MSASAQLAERDRKFASLYDRSSLYDAALRIYTKPLFCWQKALSKSSDGKTLYDFAQHGVRNLDRLHQFLLREEFHFRESIELRYRFHGRRRTIYLFPWEERIVDQLLFQMLNKVFDGHLSKHSYAYRYRGFGVDLCQHRIAKALKETAKPVYLLKRDIANYFPSVDHQNLLALLATLIPTQDYLYRLLEERVRFLIRTENGIRIAERGIPFGTPIACFFANLYLTSMDEEMAAVPGLWYFRYADDIIAFSQDRDSVLEAGKRFKAMLGKLNLSSKPSHEKNLAFLVECDSDETFANVSGFRHLGLQFCSDNKIRLPRDKARKVRNLFRYAFRRAASRLETISDAKQRARLLIGVAGEVIEHGIRSVAIVDYYLKHVDDEEQLRLIDRWLAEEVLARALRCGHRKRNFLAISFKELRAMGLPSLRHRHRLLRHGVLKTSFFLMRPSWTAQNRPRRAQEVPAGVTNGQEEKEQMEKDRGRLPGVTAFSPRLEAAATSSP